MDIIKIPIELKDKKIKVNIEMEVEEKWANKVYSFLKYLEQQCEIGNEEEIIMFMVTGKSSNFHPKFNIKNWKEPLDEGIQISRCGLKVYSTCKKLYWAGDGNTSNWRLENEHDK